VNAQHHQQLKGRTSRLGQWRMRLNQPNQLSPRSLPWQIENGLHHVRDVSFGEDASQIRKEPGVFAQLRTLALNRLRHIGHDNIKAARQIMSWSEPALLKFIGKI
jgi:hypothetical protein